MLPTTGCPVHNAPSVAQGERITKCSLDDLAKIHLRVQGVKHFVRFCAEIPAGVARPAVLGYDSRERSAGAGRRFGGCRVDNEKTALRPKRLIRSFRVMVKPVGPVCNLDCTYCYYLHEKELLPQPPAERPWDELLMELIRQSIEGQDIDTVAFSWHGGEPLLAGIDFYRRAVGLSGATPAENASRTTSRPTACCWTTSGASFSSSTIFWWG